MEYSSNSALAKKLEQLHGQPSELHIYIYGVRSSGHPTGQKVKPNMADMEALSYVGFVPLRKFYYTRKYERPRRETETT